MELKEFDLSNCKAVRTGVSSVRINKPGTFSFSRRASEILGLKEGERIKILQDKQREKDWYIMKTDSEDGFMVRRTNKNNKNPSAWSFIIANAYIANLILKSISSQEKSVGFKIAEERTKENGIELYAIITSKPIL